MRARSSSKKDYSTVFNMQSLIVLFCLFWGFFFAASAEKTDSQLWRTPPHWQHHGIAELFVFLHPLSDVTNALNEIVFKHELLGN